MLDTPYLIMAGIYSLLFVYGFSSFANYGILVRQRVQVLPFLLVFVAMPPLRSGKRRAPAADPAGVPARTS
jgi:hypothetical protein